MRKRARSLFLALAATLSLIVVPAGAAGSPAVSSNINAQDYTTWSKPVNSYLFENEANGLTFEDVVKTTCFLADMGDFGAFNAVYEKYFVSKPARSCVAVRELPKKVLCEVEIIAAFPEK